MTTWLSDLHILYHSIIFWCLLWMSSQVKQWIYFSYKSTGYLLTRHQWTVKLTMKLLLVVLVVFIVETCYCKSLDPPRIVGGDYAKVDQFPHQVALLYRGSLRCGGSIIEPGVVLTASHCLVGSDYGNLEVLAGTIDLKSGGVRRRVKKEVKHEKYGSFMNDVALLVLDEPFEFSSSIQRIELQNDELELISNVTIIGWGKTSNWGFPSQMLKYNTVKVDSIVGCSGLGYEGIICLGHPFDNGACNVSLCIFKLLMHEVQVLLF